MLFVMEASQWSTFAAVLLLLCRGLQCSPAPPTCPLPCLCPRGPLMNCSSSGLYLMPLHIPAMVTDVDLSHNLLEYLRHRRSSQNLKSLWLGNNSITHLSLCVDRPMRGHYFRDSGPRSHHGCVSWAPTLQLLSVERNQLEQLPEGLGGSGLLKVLRLSYNRISVLQPGELSYLPYLRELHLQHNSISSLHPQAFNDLPQLRVLDLSFNLLTSIPASTYVNLRNLQASVELSGNRWRCDCGLRSVSRWMAYDHDRGRQTWKMVCASPSTHSGRDLRHLKEEELSCSAAEDSTGPLRDVTVDEGSEMLLPCGSPPEDPTWWTPHGQVPGSRSPEGLLISDITERDAGLYVCVSGSTLDSLFLFNVQVRQKGVSLQTQGKTRGGRSLPRNGPQVNPLQDSVPKEDQVRNQTRATQSDLALAVCLSILFSFLVAFILGVVARPYLDTLCGRICNKRSPSPDNTAPRAEHSQYNNEAYCEEEELEQVGRHRERRVTFSAVDYKENNSVPYYDTMGGAVEEVGATDENLQQKDSSVSSSVGQQQPEERARAEDSLSEGSSQGSLEETQSKDRDLSDISLTVTQGGAHTVPPQSMEFEHIPDPDGQEERRSLSSDSSHSSQSDKDSQGVGTTTSGVKRKAPKSPREAQSPQLEEDNFQQRSTSPIRSVVVPQISTGDAGEIPGFTSEPFADWGPNLNDPNLLDPEQWNDSGESFEFPDSTRSSNQDLSTLATGDDESKRYLERDNNMADHLNQNPPPPPSFSLEHSGRSSSCSSIDSGPTEYTVNAEREKEEDEVKNAKLTHEIFEQHSHGEHHPSEERFYQADYGQDGQSSPVESEQSFSSHSSGRPESALEPEAQWPDMGLINVPKIKRRLDIKAPSPPPPSPPPFNENVERGPWSDLVSSTPKADAEPELKLPDLGSINVPQIKRRLDIEAPQKAPTAPLPIPTTNSFSSSSESEDETTDKPQPGDEVRLPNIDNIDVPKIKRRLNIKAPSPPPPSSPPNVEEIEWRTKHDLSSRPTPAVKTDPEGSWPELNLMNIPNLKRRLDIKAPSPPPPSPPPIYEKVERRPIVDLSSPLHKVEQEPKGSWPDLGLINVPKLKRRLDIKVPAPPYSSSSSEDETTDYTVKQKETKVEYVASTSEWEPKSDGSWPDLGLMKVPKMKRRLDVKAPSPPPPSTPSPPSNLEEIEWRTKHDLSSRPTPAVKTDPEGSWPEVSLITIPKLKRRLDIKAPSPPPPSTPPTYEKVERRPIVDLSNPLPKVEQEPKGSWPDLSLINVPKLKRRLDIKVPAPRYSSSSSEDETTDYTVKQKEATVEYVAPPSEWEPKSDGSWPDLGLMKVPKMKRRLDIKAPSPPPPSTPTYDKVESRPIVDLSSPLPKVEPKGSGPDLGLINVPKLKRRLDIKVPSTPPPSTPPNLEEIEWRTKHDLSSRPTPAVKTDPEGSWPEVSLITIPKLKRRLDIKAPSPPPPSTPPIYEKVERRPIVDLTSPLPKVEPAAEGSWPDLGLINVPKLKRRLDIKVPAPPYSSSSSEDETTDYTVKQKEATVEYVAPPSEWEPKSDGSWPDLGLMKVPKIKRRLDIKAPSPPPPSTPIYDKVESRPIVDLSSPLPKVEPKGSWPDLGLINVPKLKRRLDIKVPSPPPPSTPPNLEEIEWRTKHDLSSGPTPEVKTDPEGSWPEVSLITIPKLKRRLDIKAPSPPPPSTPPTYEKVERRPIVDLTSPLPKVEPVPKGSWPDLGLINVPKLKRRLDIKVPAPRYSSSSSEDETTDYTVKQKETKVEYVASTSEWEPKSNGSWPDLGLMKVPKIKRHLDIKAPSPPPPSTPSYEKVESRPIVDLSSPLPKVEPKGSWPDLGLINVPKLKRRLDIKAPSPPPPSTPPTYEKGERRPIVDLSSPLPKVEPEPKGSWPDLGLINVPKLKRRLDIKAPSPPTSLHGSVSSSGDSDVESTVRQESGSESKWPDVGLISIPKLKRRLDIKAPSPPDSETTETKTRLELSSSPLKVYKEPVRELTSLGPAMPGYRTHYIRQQHPTGLHDSGTGVKITDTTADYTLTQRKVTEVRDQYVFPKSRLDVKAPSPQLDSEKIESEARLDLSSSNTPKVQPEPEAKLPDLGLINIPPLRRRLDISGPRETLPAAPSTPTADLLLHCVDTTDLTVHPRERQGTQEFAREKASSLSLGDIHVSLAPRRAFNINYDSYAEEMGRKMELSSTTLHGRQRPEARLSSISRHTQSTVRSIVETGAGDYPTVAPYGRGVLVDTPPPKEAPPELPDAPPPDSTGDSGDDMKNETTAKYTTKSYNYSSISHAGVPLAPRRAIDIHFDNSSSSTDDLEWGVRSEGKREKQGLGALKALSSERQQWDTVEEEKGDYSLTYQRPISSKYRDTHDEDEPKLSLTKASLLSTDPKEDQRTGSPSRVSRLRRRLVVDIQSPLELPPPAPETPPPALGGEWETAGSRLRSPLRGETHVWRSTEPYQPRGRAIEGLSLSPQSTMFREDDVDRRSSLVGLQGATPYHTARQYQSVTSTTTTQKRSPDYNERNVSFSTLSKTTSLPFETSRGSISEV